MWANDKMKGYSYSSKPGLIFFFLPINDMHLGWVVKEELGQEK